LDTGKVVNLHKFKLAAFQSLNLQITFFWLLLEPINVLQTTFFGFNLFIYLLIQEIQNEALQM